MKKINSNFSLVIFDSLRPFSVQLKMWEIVKGTDMEKYVASPSNDSSHNYGTAVDVSIASNHSGGFSLLDMGTSFDFFGPLAEPRYENRFLKEKKAFF